MDDVTEVADIQAEVDADEQAGERRQCLLVTIGGELYAFDLLSIKEILRTAKKERAPGAPPFVAGLINLRGEIVTVLDAAVLLGISEKQRAASEGENAGESPEESVAERSDTEARIVVLEGSNQTIGVQVGTLEEVIEYDPNAVQPADAENQAHVDDYIGGLIAREDGTLVILMNAEALCAG